MSTKIFLHEQLFSDGREAYGMITAARAGRYYLRIEKSLGIVSRGSSAPGSEALPENECGRILRSRRRDRLVMLPCFGDMATKLKPGDLLQIRQREVRK